VVGAVDPVVVDLVAAVAASAAAARPAAGEGRTMSLFGELERSRIADAVAEVEQRTNAELVTVLAARSADYVHHMLAWASIAALLVCVPLALLQLSLPVVLSSQLAVFCGLVLLFRIPALARRLVPRRLGHWHAANMARRQFLEQGLHHTKRETGGRWQSIVDRLIENVQRNHVLTGFASAIAECGEILAEAVPKTADNPNELANRLVVIGYD
jgi:putative membrane protein